MENLDKLISILKDPKEYQSIQEAWKLSKHFKI